MNKITTYLDDEASEALDRYHLKTRKSKSLIINDAVREVLLPSQPKDPSAALRKRLDQLGYQLKRHDEDVMGAVALLKEMLGLFVRVYLNHTPEVEQTDRGRASASGRKRFERFVSMLAESLETGRSILDEAIPPESSELPSPNQPDRIDPSSIHEEDSIDDADD